MNPSVSRIVHFHFALEVPVPDTESETVIVPSAPQAAIVTEVVGETDVHLHIFPPNQMPYPMYSVPFSEEPSPGCWSWPPLV